MTLTMFRGKIHRARVTEANLYYEGSITIDSDLLRASTLLPYEKVQVVNVNNGARLETYIIPGEAGTGIVCMNGPAARFAGPPWSRRRRRLSSWPSAKAAAVG